MLRLDGFTGIYFYGGVVDFRRSIDGLGQLVKDVLQKDIFGKFLFVFVSRDKRKIKCLYWDGTGFAIWYKRLEEARFPLPRHREAATIYFTVEQMEWLLSGIEWWKMKRHQSLQFKEVS